MPRPYTQRQSAGHAQKTRGFIRPLAEAGPLPLMRVEAAFEGEPLDNIIRAFDAGLVTVYQAGDELLTSRPMFEMAVESLKVEAA